jgi:flavodoxin
MDILIVYGSQFGNTHRLARVMGEALAAADHRVRVVDSREAQKLDADGIDLIVVGAPTQMGGLRLLVRSFLDGLEEHGFAGKPAAAFDTRLEGPREQTGAESDVIARHLAAAGCRLVAPPESFIVRGMRGPLADGEEERAASWAVSVVEAVVADPVTR